MAATQFKQGDTVRFHGQGEEAVVERLSRQPYRTSLVWLRFPDMVDLVCYTQNDLRKCAKVVT